MARVVNPRTFRLQPSTFGPTPIATPVVTAFDVGRLVYLERLRIVIPAGHVGLTGIAVRMEGTVVLPWSGGSPWLVGNGHDWVFEMGDLEMGNPLQVLTYNLDRRVHTHEIHATVRDVERHQQSTTSLVTAL